MSVHWRNTWLTVVICISMVGCHLEVDSGPSYADLVVTYNAELETLDRLEAQREKLIQEFAATTSSDASVDTLAQLEGLVKSAQELKDAANEDTSTDPDSRLDGLLDRGGEAQEIAGQLLDGLRNEGDSTKPDPTPEEAAAIAERKKVFEAELAKLDAEIKTQQARVDRARQARDEAELKARPEE